MKLTQTYRVQVYLHFNKWDAFSLVLLVRNGRLRWKERQIEWERMILKQCVNETKIDRNIEININDTIMIFRTDGVLFDSTFSEMDAANRAWCHIGIIGL